MKSIKIAILIATLLIFGSINNSVISADVPGVDENTMLYFKFDEGSGKEVKDLSDNGNDGTITDAKWVEGKFGKALEFEDDDFVEIIDSESLDIAENITIEVWVNPDDDDGGYVMLKKGSYGFPKFVGSNSFQFYLNVGGQTITDTVVGQIEVKTWQHYAAVYDGKEMRQYVNGKEVLVQPHKGGIGISADNITVGHSFGWHKSGARNFAGKIDELRVSDIARTIDEIKEAMNGFATAVNSRSKLAVNWGWIKENQ